MTETQRPDTLSSYDLIKLRFIISSSYTMNLRSLKLFCDVVGRRSFSRAAEENGMTQPAVSQVVQQLEDQLGLRLIDRSKRPLVVTPAGHKYYEGCRRIVQQYHQLEDEVRGLNDAVAGRVRVASIVSVGLAYMKEILQRFKEAYPAATVQLDYQQPDRIYELVSSEEADLGLVSYPKRQRSIELVPWREEPMALVCSPEHPLARQSVIRPGDLSGVEMVGFYQNLQIRREIDRALSAHHVSVRVMFEFDNIEHLKRAIEVNSGVSFLPTPTVANEVARGSLTAKSVEGMQLVRPVGIISRRGHSLGTTARRFLELLRRESSIASHRSGPDSDAGRAA